MIKISKPLITFLTPTLGRDTLPRAIKSIEDQKLNCWMSLVCFDGILPNIKEKPKIKIMSCLKKRQAGLVRNEMIPLVSTKWIGFLDDDDMLTPNAMEIIKDLDKKNYDLIFFRLSVQRGRKFWMHPKESIKTIKDARMGDLTMSFIIKKEFVDKNNLRFSSGVGEDYRFLKECDSLGANYLFCEKPIYFVDRSGHWR